jgi:lipoprotein-anchoring transpeptidase ErfK/SrfK
MLKNPTWQHPWKGTIIPPGKENPLGDRWIAFWSDGTNFIGFHGTPNEKTVGTPASHGCIRMKNRDIRKLFEQVAVGTSVLVEK